MKNLRNFAIIAHVDHGKSTLADRFLELTDVVSPGKHEEQLLDRNPISRERGITIKLAPVQMAYKEFILNLIDTPGHVDFSYEVDRTLACVEGVILLVDATQGIQAQTISNAFKALEKDLTIIPVVNKIDMPSAEVEKTKQELIDFLCVKNEEIMAISAKTGENVEMVLAKIVKDIPEPSVVPIINRQLQALIFDSYFDPYKGVVSFVRIMAGTVRKNERLYLIVGNRSFTSLEVGIFSPELKQTNQLSEGEIG